MFKSAIQKYKFVYTLKWLFEHFLGKGLSNYLFTDWLTRCGHAAYPAPTQDKKISTPTEKVTTVEQISLKDYRKHFLNKNIPVVIKECAKDWACVQNWSFDSFSEKYGDDLIEIIDARPEGNEHNFIANQKFYFRDVLEQIKKGSTSHYSRFNRLLHLHPELLADVDLKWLKQHKNFINSGNTFQSFIGAAHSETHMHAASEHNLFIQVHGLKQWYLYPPKYNYALRPVVNRSPYFYTEFNPRNPDYDKFPEMRDVPVTTVQLSAGDIFFNPPSWWHHVYNPTASIGIGYRWFSPLGSFQSSFMQALLTITATNPNILFATLNRTNFPKIFSASIKNKTHSH